METIKVRIALEINPKGDWQAMGSYAYGDDDWEGVMDAFEPLDGNAKRLWIEAEVTVPAAEPETVKGEAVPA